MVIGCHIIYQSFMYVITFSLLQDYYYLAPIISSSSSNNNKVREAVYLKIFLVSYRFHGLLSHLAMAI